MKVVGHGLGIIQLMFWIVFTSGVNSIQVVHHYQISLRTADG